MNRLLFRKPLLAVAALCIASAGIAQQAKTDTVLLDIPSAEQRLVSQSLLLLAARYDVDIARSQVTQARAWYNPNIVYTQSLYDPASGAWLDNAPSTGQVDVQITQLFPIAGRHINAVRLAELEVKHSQLAFDELARSLKFEMYSDLCDLYELQQTNRLISAEVAQLDRLIFSARKEFGLGASAGNEVIRLEAERQSGLADKLANQLAIEEIEGRLRVLLGFPAGIWLRIRELPLPAGNLPALDSLLQLASARPDVQLAANDVQLNSRNLSLQRSQGAPDLLLGTEYDRRSSYTSNLWMVSAGIDVPVFNRNQGNIRAAKYGLLQAQCNDSLSRMRAQSEVYATYGEFIRIRTVRDSMYARPGLISGKQNGPRGSYAEDLELLFANAVDNYSSHRISLIEFLDQLRTYDDARRNVIALDAGYFLSAQKLNYVTGTSIVR